MAEAELDFLNSLSPCHPLRRSLLQYVLLHQDLADEKTVSAVRSEYERPDLSVLRLYNLTRNLDLENAENILKLRSLLQSFYFQISRCSNGFSFTDVLHSEKNDFWKYSFWVLYKFKFMDIDDAVQKDLCLFLKVCLEFVKKLCNTLKTLSTKTVFKLVPEDEIQPVCVGMCEIIRALASGKEPVDCIKKYEQKVSVVSRLIQFKNWLAGSFSFDDAFSLWLKFPECIRYFDEELKQQISLDIVEILSCVSDKEISVEILNCACEYAMRKFVDTRSIQTVEQVMENVLDMMQAWGVYSGEYQVVKNQLVVKCRRLANGE